MLMAAGKGQLIPELQKTNDIFYMVCVRDFNPIMNSFQDPYAEEPMRCVLCPKNFSVPIRPSWKNPKLLSQFVSPHTGLVYKKHITGLCEFMQCEVEREVKRAQQFGKIFISSILTLFGTGGGGIFLSPCPCWISSPSA